MANISNRFNALKSQDPMLQSCSNARFEINYFNHSEQFVESNDKFIIQEPENGRMEMYLF